MQGGTGEVLVGLEWFHCWYIKVCLHLIHISLFFFDNAKYSPEIKNSFLLTKNEKHFTVHNPRHSYILTEIASYTSKNGLRKRRAYRDGIKRKGDKIGMEYEA